MTKGAGIALVALAVLATPAAVRAAPATIRVFEAKVHASPDPSSPVIHVFPENTRVSVSEEVVNGFRKVRLPAGEVGYVEESALSLGPARPAPRSPAPAPPPPFAPGPRSGYAPPPPPPPPPGPPGYYPGRRYYDPSAFRHVGFFLRLDLGLGYMGSSTSASATGFTFDSADGVAGELGIAIGGALAENLILAGHFWGAAVASPNLTLRGADVLTGGDFSISVFGIGPSFNYYFMPQNVYVSVTPSVTWVRFSDAFGSFDTAAGFGTRLAVGKDWWLGPHWSLGLAGWFAFSFNEESDGAGPTWKTYAGGLAFSLGIN